MASVEAASRSRSLPRDVMAETLGAAMLLAAVVGSGIMADRLTQDHALQLLCNTLATGAMLFVAIALFAPISGAHFNRSGPRPALAFFSRPPSPRSDNGSVLRIGPWSNIVPRAIRPSLIAAAERSMINGLFIQRSAAGC